MRTNYEGYKERESRIGRIGTVELDGLQVKVSVLDEKFAYGRIDAKVTPVEGSGERWVNLGRITF